VRRGARTPRRTAAIFAGVILALAILGALLPDKLGVAGFSTPDSESTRTVERLHRSLGFDPEPGMVALVMARDGGSATSAPARAALADVARQIRRDPDVGRVVTPYENGGDNALIADDGRSVLVLVHFREIDEKKSEAPIDRIRDDVESDSLDVTYGGFDVGFLDDNRVVQEDLLRAQVVAIPTLAIVLFFVFRGFSGALLTLVIGAVAEVGTFAGLTLLSQWIDVSAYALNLASVLGLGLAVDYGLFVVTRYREEIAAGRDEQEAVQVTMATAGRAVLYSGLTVAGACAALMLFPQNFIFSMGVGGVLTSLLAAIGAVVVLPPLLPRAGRVKKATPADVSGGAWFRWSAWVMRRAVPVALVSAIVILAAGIPAFDAKWTFLDRQALPHELESRHVADAIAADFEPNLDFPIVIAADPSLAADAARLESFQRDVARLPTVGLVGDPIRARDGTAMIPLLSRAPPLSDESQRLVEDLRAVDAPVSAGGRIADFVDLKDSIRERAPYALALVIVASLIVLFLLTGSAVLPVKALLMNALTMAGVFGLLVLIFQDGLLGIADLLDFQGPAALETSMAVVVVGVTLGLATDYSVLLLSRIKEEHDAGQPNEIAVATGLERSGRVITNASLLLAMALMAGAASRVFLVKELVIGIAIGVLIDATIVRACLVPALMRILGDVNWWAPRPLRRLHAALDARLARRAEPLLPTGSPEVRPDPSRSG
jgi:RND superfamily putative drug exporter